MTIVDRPSSTRPYEPDRQTLVRDERVVKSGFWRKIRSTMGKVPFAEEAVAAFYCATDRDTPRHVRAVIFGALAYFVLPADMIPDFIVGLGFTDDATVFLAAYSAVRGYLTQDHRSRAQIFFDGGDPPHN